MISNTTVSKLNLLDLKEYIKKINTLDLKFRDKLDIDENLKFGFEIEFSDAFLYTIKDYIKFNINRNINSKYNYGGYICWNVVEEPTVENYLGDLKLGGEVVSPILSNNIETWKQLHHVCQILKECGANTRKCGGHIHIDKNYFIKNNNTDDFYYNLLVMWYYYEKVITKFGYGDLKHKRLCSIIYSKTIHTLNKKIDITDKRNVLLIDNILKNKRYSLAFRKDLNTIELRYHNGSLNPITWQNNLNFDYHLLYSAYKIDIEKLKYKISNNENDELKDLLELADFIFNNDLEKMYFLKSYFNSTNLDKKIIKRKSL